MLFAKEHDKEMNDDCIFVYPNDADIFWLPFFVLFSFESIFLSLL
jgi:hypothetical protein